MLASDGDMIVAKMAAEGGGEKGKERKEKIAYGERSGFKSLTFP